VRLDHRTPAHRALSQAATTRTGSSLRTTRRYSRSPTAQPSAFALNGRRLDVVVDATDLCCLRDLMMMMMMIVDSRRRVARDAVHVCTDSSADSSSIISIALDWLIMFLPKLKLRVHSTKSILNFIPFAGGRISQLLAAATYGATGLLRMLFLTKSSKCELCAKDTNQQNQSRIITHTWVLGCR